MAIMKQIDQCLVRAFQGKPPALSKKWKGFIEYNYTLQSNALYLYHYQHLVLIYDCSTKKIIYEWYEKPTDKRGLDSAKEWLQIHQGLNIAM